MDIFPFFQSSTLFSFQHCPYEIGVFVFFFYFIDKHPNVQSKFKYVMKYKYKSKYFILSKQKY